MAWASSNGTYESRKAAADKAEARAKNLGHTLGPWSREKEFHSKNHGVMLRQSTAVCGRCNSGVTMRVMPTGRVLRFTGLALKSKCLGQVVKDAQKGVSMSISGYAAALEDAILLQLEEGIVCPTCGKTRVEHYFKKSQTCGSLDGFEGGDAQKIERVIPSQGR